MTSIASRLRDLVLASPKDPAIRSVYADALIQEGDPRGTFIALQTHLEGAIPPDKREAARQQIDALLRENQEKWTEPTRGWAEVRFKRGFIYAIRATAESFVAHAPALLAAEPVLDVTLTQVTDEHMAALAQLPAIARLSALACQGSFEDAGAAALARSPHLAAVTSLNLRGSGLGATFAHAAAKLGNLAWLSVTGMGMGDEAVALLVEGDAHAFERLYLSRNDLSDEAATALGQSRGLGKLRILCLGGNELSDEGAVALAKGKSLASLTSLELNQTGVSDEGALAIASSRALKSLRKINLKDTEIGDEGFAGLAKRKALTVLR